MNNEMISVLIELCKCKSIDEKNRYELFIFRRTI